MAEDGHVEDRAFLLIAGKGHFGELRRPAEAGRLDQHGVASALLRSEVTLQCGIPGGAEAGDVDLAVLLAVGEDDVGVQFDDRGRVG